MSADTARLQAREQGCQGPVSSARARASVAQAGWGRRRWLVARAWGDVFSGR